MAGTPIKLTVYNSDHEPVKELSQSFIPWGIMKRAIRLFKTMKLKDKAKVEDIMAALDDSLVDEMTGLVCDVFGGRVTIEELNQGVEVTEMLPVIMSVVNSSFARMGANKNPTPPGA